MSKQITLSNGTEIEAFVGDGFDGCSGILTRIGGDPFKKDRTEAAIPVKDIPKVVKLLKWYVREEMKLRRYEGTVYGDWDHAKLKIDLHNPYQVTFYQGHLEEVLRRSKK